uniref:Uncharacterized protein n=1 Tax=Cacopsylla melanoneura TaxID=428564 RepID=A0A8D8YRT5_9HEMI
MTINSSSQSFLGLNEVELKRFFWNQIKILRLLIDLKVRTFLRMRAGQKPKMVILVFIFLFIFCLGQLKYGAHTIPENLVKKLWYIVLYMSSPLKYTSLPVVSIA